METLFALLLLADINATWIVSKTKVETPQLKVRLEFALKAAPEKIVDTLLVDFVSPESLKAIASEHARALEARRTAFDALQNGTLLLEDPEPEAPPVSDPAREAFIAAQNLVVQYEQAVGKGLTDKSGDYKARLDAARTDMKSKYKEEYLPLLRGN